MDESGREAQDCGRRGGKGSISRKPRFIPSWSFGRWSVVGGLKSEVYWSVGHGGAGRGAFDLAEIDAVLLIEAELTGVVVIGK